MAIEIGLKPRQLHPNSKKQKSTGSVSGSVGGKKHKVTNGLGAIARAEQIKQAHEKTLANKKILLIDAHGKRRFILVSEYETTRQAA